jgi:hypothetical protein
LKPIVTVHVTQSLARRVVVAMVAVVTLAAVAGCASPAAEIPGDYVDLTLAETKSPAQSLRTEAAGRLPGEVIDKKVESDLSVACLSTTDDPGGLIRSWHSSIDVTIVAGYDITALLADLVDSFTVEGWVARPLGGSASVTSQLLESESVESDIQISGLTGIQDQPTITIQVHGPCVRTDGPESAEVLTLEV